MKLQWQVSFTEAGAQVYRRDVPDSELHMFETGHFAPEEEVATIARLILDFLNRKLRSR